MGEDVRIQFRTEFFNAFNHAQFEAGSSSNVVSVNFGKALSARLSREIQFGLKVSVVKEGFQVLESRKKIKQASKKWRRLAADKI